MADFKKVAKVDEIDPGQMKSFEIDYDRILIANIDGKFYAVTDECSHDSAPISTGHLHGDEIVCPRHGARFKAATGAVCAPPAVVPIDSYEIKIEDDYIYVNLGD